MKKRILIIGSVAAALCSGPALALQNVANTSQQGSLLIYPLINVAPEDSSNTLIEISNGQTTAVHVECEYVNEKKDRVDFDFHLTGKATVSWDVLNRGRGDISPPNFPSGGTFPGTKTNPPNPARGELICFATDTGGTSQIAFNRLTGTATVIDLNDKDASQAKQAFKYNAWSFVARDSSGNPAADNTPQGTPGDLQLTGANDGSSYDGCPGYNIVEFMPNGATLDGVRTIDNDLSVVSCNQDLRQDFKLHTTKLKFYQWAANENSYSGTYICVDSVTTVALGGGDRSTDLKNGSNFDFSVLRTDNARYEVHGLSSTQCPVVPFGTTEITGLLGVATASLALGGDSLESQEVGNTTQGAGILPGFVLWDPAGPAGFSGKKHVHAN